MKHLGPLLAAVLLAGCQDQTLMGAESRRAPTVGAALAATTDPANAQLAIDDAVDRIAPALGDVTSARPLVAALQGLRVALDAGSVTDGPALARVARAELDRYAQIQPGDAPELDALSLALAVVIGTS
jgi:hypothetical protein